MAALAGLREPRSRVIRDRAPERCGALPGSHMATIAGCRSRSECVVVADVAGNAGRRRRGNVHPRQNKPRRRVIEHRARPSRSRMAVLAGLRETSRNMIRHRTSERGGALPRSDVATVAGC